MDGRPRDLGYALLSAAVGARLEGVARVHWMRGDDVDAATGPLELAFDDGRLLHLTTAPNAESLWVRAERWEPSPEWPLTDEDRAYIAEHGTEARVDARSQPGWADALGRRLEGVRWLANEFGVLAGAELDFGGARMTFVSWGDDEWVFPGDASSIPPGWGFRVLAGPDPPIPTPEAR